MQAFSRFSAPRVAAMPIVGLLIMFSAADADDAGQAYSLQKIPAGTPIVNGEAPRWNTLVLMATPVIASGDVRQIPEAIRRSVSRFSMTFMATVRRAPAVVPAGAIESDISGGRESPPGDYELVEVGVGYSALVGQRQMMISAADADRVGLSLGFIERQVLSRNEEGLTAPEVVARSPTMMMFDMPAVIMRAGKHQDETMRHLVWVDPKSGSSAVALWLVGARPKRGGSVASLPVYNDAMRILPTGRQVQNRIHYDASETFLGFPTRKSFGIEQLPEGQAVNWTENLRRVAGESSYSRQGLAQFTSALKEAMSAGR